MRFLTGVHTLTANALARLTRSAPPARVSFSWAPQTSITVTVMLSCTVCHRGTPVTVFKPGPATGRASESLSLWAPGVRVWGA